jgi:CotS family spore coat protein
MLTDELRTRLENAFGVRFLRSVRLRTVLGVQTNGGAMVVKRYEHGSFTRRLEVLADLLDAILGEGVEIAPYLKTRQGLPYLLEKNHLYTIQPWLPGRHLSLSNREERLLAARTLAGLHKVPVARRSPRSFLMRVPPLWEKYRHRLERAQDATFKEQRLREEWRPYAERARQAVIELQRGPYLRALERDWEFGSLCHRDPAPHNLIVSDGQAGLIDFDLAGFDARVHDLYQLMNHALYLNGWEPGLFEEMIEAYDRVLPLCADNRKVLDSLMMYPSLVVREWYDFAKTGNRDTLRHRLRWVTLQEQKRLKALRA